MNKRIKKKKQKLAAMCVSTYKHAKLGRKIAHAFYIQSRRCMWGMIPHKDHYAMFLRRQRRQSIKQYALTKRCLMMYQAERKEVKEKLFLKEGEYNNG